MTADDRQKNQEAGHDKGSLTERLSHALVFVVLGTFLVFIGGFSFAWVLKHLEGTWRLGIGFIFGLIVMFGMRAGWDALQVLVCGFDSHLRSNRTALIVVALVSLLSYLLMNSLEGNL